ncbi:MAG: outer membrane beta-barrel protein [Bacteroidales bacterium]|nr:outer membrane beta-barrel protein [Bacteroidales bacterium]
MKRGLLVLLLLILSGHGIPARSQDLFSGPVEFEAVQFRVGENATLKDLLKNMPGMEVSQDGKVSFNGEELDCIKIGGWPFFFDDQSTAVFNLPARMVEKVTIVDNESEQTRASGIQDGEREKELDIELKPEFMQGWSGLLELKGGVTRHDDRRFLYGGNLLASVRSDKDQLTLVMNSQNINSSDMAVVIEASDDEEEAGSPDGGISSAAQCALNVNTSRLKDVETSVSANYKYIDTDTETQSARVSWGEGGEFSTNARKSGKRYVNSASAEAELLKEDGRVWFHIRPSYVFKSVSKSEESSSVTERENTVTNKSRGSESGVENTGDLSLSGDVTIRELGDRSGRTLGFSAGAFYSSTEANSEEQSQLELGSAEEDIFLRNETRASSYGIEGAVRYTEPLGPKLTLSATGRIDFSRPSEDIHAYDRGGYNKYYSSSSSSKTLNQVFDLTFQYVFGPQTWLTAGGRVSGTMNETYTRSFDVEETTGAGEFMWFFSPSLRFQHSTSIDRLTVDVSGYSREPSPSLMLPVLNVADPSRISTGNIYLKPYGSTTLNANWTRNDKPDLTMVSVSLSGQLDYNSISSALWYDADGIQYSVPVNSRAPAMDISLSSGYSSALDKDGLLAFSVSGSAEYAALTSYQAGSELAGLDIEAFDYPLFMSTFWGGKDGERFYSGSSRFRESRTQVITPMAGISLKYNPGRCSFSVGASSVGRVALYSLDSGANQSTQETHLTARTSYLGKRGLNFSTDLTYVFYYGFEEGYGSPEWQWNAELSQKLGPFNLFLKVHDILNQTTNLTRTITANYTEDSYRMVLGRYVLFGLKWNFG